MTYCMADIHGEYEKYIEMLKHIDFSEDDTLYIIGDVIDRGPRGVDILLDIMERPNVQMLLGNHEQMCVDDLHWHEWEAQHMWHNNGGACTRRDLLHREPEVRKKIIDFLRFLPTFMDVEVNGQVFHLVHGYPDEDSRERRLWKRPPSEGPAPLPGKIAIVGHTPTVYLNGDDGTPFKLWYGEGVIGIDCGCGFQAELSRLACLRLDDMTAFYIQYYKE